MLAADNAGTDRSNSLHLFAGILNAPKHGDMMTSWSFVNESRRWILGSKMTVLSVEGIPRLLRKASAGEDQSKDQSCLGYDSIRVVPPMRTRPVNCNLD